MAEDGEYAPLLVAVRADKTALARDVADMRQLLEEPLVAGADRAGRAIEGALLRAVRSGKFGFEDLKRVALSVMADIANAALRAALTGGAASGAGGGGGALSGLIGNILGAAFGLPGRASGGPVAPGQAYLVGERGPEVFVPTMAGRVDAGAARGGGGGGGGARDIRITVNVAGQSMDAPRMAASARQVARAVRRAVEQAG